MSKDQIFTIDLTCNTGFFLWIFFFFNFTLMNDRVEMLKFSHWLHLSLFKQNINRTNQKCFLFFNGSYKIQILIKKIISVLTGSGQPIFRWIVCEDQCQQHAFIFIIVYRVFLFNVYLSVKECVRMFLVIYLLDQCCCRSSKIDGSSSRSSFCHS